MDEIHTKEKLAEITDRVSQSNAPMLVILREIIVACPSKRHLAEFALVVAEASIGNLALVKSSAPESRKHAKELQARIFVYNAIINEMQAQLERMENPS